MKPARLRRAEGRSRERREKVMMRVVVSELVWGGGDREEGRCGAKRSEMVPVERRAKVLVRAMMETCVLAVPAGGWCGFDQCLGVRAGMMVPRLLM